MTKFGVAQPVRRVEDRRLLTGSGRYTDDLVLPGMLHGVVVRSPYAAARIAGGVTGLNAILPDSAKLNKSVVLQVLSDTLNVTEWLEVRGPDSMRLR